MSTEAAVFKFSVDQFERMAELGIFGPNERIELLDGEIYNMAAIGVGHAWCVDKLTELLSRQLEGRAVLRVQNPAVLSDLTEPQPDLQLLSAPADRYRTAHPRPSDVLLLTEVSDTTVRFDRTVKRPIYARTGVAEVWLIDLQAERAEVHREPTGDGYATTEFLDRDGVLRPEALPDVSIAVGDILP